MDNIALKKTPGELARCYEQVSSMIDEAYGILLKAKSIYQETYDESFDPVAGLNHHDTAGALDAVQKELKRYSWRRIIDMMQVHKLTSNKRWKEIQERLYDKRADDMPAITEQEIVSMYQAYAENAGSIFAEAVKEVWDYLRPGRSRFDNYKTNSPDRVGEKVILTSVLEHLWKGNMRVSYYYDKDISNVDKVFHALDGNSAEYLRTGYRSNLVDTINANPIEGETKYFSWKGYQNGNLHLTIKRMDLVEAMAKILRENALSSGVTK